MLPVPRRRLCQDEPPERSRPAIGATWRMSPRRSRSSAELTTAIPAAASAASPSTVARSRRVSASGPGSSRPGRRCRGSSSACGASRPSRRRAARRRSRPGGRPPRRLAGGVGAARERADVEDPGTGLQCCSTTPGSRWPVGIITHTPCTSSKKRSSVGSLATPFCTETTGVVGTGQDGHEVLERRVRLVALHREEHRHRTVPGRLARVRGGGYVDRAGARRRGEGQPVASQGGQVPAARHQHDVLARLVEQAAQHSADGPGAVHDPSHRLSLVSVNQG